jgi:hypothetical protein
VAWLDWRTRTWVRWPVTPLTVPALSGAGVLLTELLRSRLRIRMQEAAMRTYFNRIPTAVWLVASLPVLFLTRCVVTTVVPIVVHAVVPEVVRTVFGLV